MRTFLLLAVSLVLLESTVHGDDVIKKQSRCDGPKVAGYCRARVPTWFFNKETGTCKLIHYGGCLENANRFRTKTECESVCAESEPTVCHLPVVTGPCRAYIRRFHYSGETGSCQMFVYGGCKGNSNNFKSREECESRCDDPCSQPLKRGPCFAHLKRYYFHQASGRCRRFPWGGCLPNSNNFESREACARRCVWRCHGIECFQRRTHQRRGRHFMHHGAH